MATTRFSPPTGIAWTNVLWGILFCLILQTVRAETGLRFDVVQLCCDCPPDKKTCAKQLEHLNWVGTNAHYLAMTNDASLADIRISKNLLAAYYGNLNEGWITTSPTARVDSIDKFIAANFTNHEHQVKWLILGEISAGLWPEDQRYREWVVDVLARLANEHKYSVIICSPFEHPGARDKDWQAVATNAYIGIERSLGGQWVKNHTNSVESCRKAYAYSKKMYMLRGVPENRLFLVENFSNTGPDKSWGRQGVSAEDWEKAIVSRSAAARLAKFIGFVGLGWSQNLLNASEDERIHFEDVYRAQTLP